MENFIKTKRATKKKLQLLMKRPSAFMLLYCIASVADIFTGIAIIKDYRIYTKSRQIFRNDVRFLNRTGLVTRQPNHVYTTMKLESMDIFDVLLKKPNRPIEPPTEPPTYSKELLERIKNKQKEKQPDSESELKASGSLFPAKAAVFLAHFNKQLRKTPYRLTDREIELYSQYVGDDPDLTRHNELIGAIDRIKAHDWWSEHPPTIKKFFAEILDFSVLESGGIDTQQEKKQRTSAELKQEITETLRNAK